MSLPVEKEKQFLDKNFWSFRRSKFTEHFLRFGTTKYKTVNQRVHCSLFLVQRNAVTWIGSNSKILARNSSKSPLGNIFHCVSISLIYKQKKKKKKRSFPENLIVFGNVWYGHLFYKPHRCSSCSKKLLPCRFFSPFAKLLSFLLCKFFFWGLFERLELHSSYPIINSKRFYRLYLDHRKFGQSLSVKIVENLEKQLAYQAVFVKEKPWDWKGGPRTCVVPMKIYCVSADENRIPAMIWLEECKYHFLLE